MDLPRKLTPFVHRGERVLWHGRPNRTFVFRPILAVFALAGLVVIGVFGWAGHMIRQQDDGLGGLFFSGLGFFVGGIFLIAPTVTDVLARKRTYYVVTDRAVIILVEMGKPPYTPVRYSYREIRLKRFRDILSLIPFREADGTSRVRFDAPKQMTALEDADHVEALIRSQMEKHTPQADL